MTPRMPLVLVMLFLFAANNPENKLTCTEKQHLDGPESYPIPCVLVPNQLQEVMIASCGS
jgi:hypothetical protein